MKTAYLGQYTDELANAIVGDLEKAGIAWHYKQAGPLSRVLFAGEWGTRLYVDGLRIDEARDIAKRAERRAELRREDK